MATSLVPPPTMDDYVLGIVLGTGISSKVFRAQHRLSGKLYAIKEITTDYFLDRGKKKYIDSEIAILRSIQHVNIVQFHHLLRRGDNLYYIMEYCSGGDLYHFIRDRKRLSEETTRHFMYQLACGLDYLSSRNYLHRDIKSHNLLLSEISENAVLKICDFGFAREMASMSMTNLGTPIYMAPEVKNGRYDHKADMWSAGVVMYEMIAGQYPFTGSNRDELARNIERQRLLIPRAVNASSSCLDALVNLFRKSSARRYSASDLLQSDFLRGYTITPSVDVDDDDSPIAAVVIPVEATTTAMVDATAASVVSEDVKVEAPLESSSSSRIRPSIIQIAPKTFQKESVSNLSKAMSEKSSSTTTIDATTTADSPQRSTLPQIPSSSSSSSTTARSSLWKPSSSPVASTALHLMQQTAAAGNSPHVKQIGTVPESKQEDGEEDYVMVDCLLPRANNDDDAIIQILMRCDDLYVKSVSLCACGDCAIKYLYSLKSRLISSCLNSIYGKDFKAINHLNLFSQSVITGSDMNAISNQYQFTPPPAAASIDISSLKAAFEHDLISFNCLSVELSSWIVSVYKLFMESALIVNRAFEEIKATIVTMTSSDAITDKRKILMGLISHLYMIVSKRCRDCRCFIHSLSSSSASEQKEETVSVVSMDRLLLASALASVKKGNIHELCGDLTRARNMYMLAIGQLKALLDIYDNCSEVIQGQCNDIQKFVSAMTDHLNEINSI